MNIRPITDKLLTRADLAKFLQVTTRTVDNLRAKGMPTVMVGASPRFDKSAVQQWLAAKGVEDGDRGVH
jgi:excisionase family DNA binding protein